MKNLIIVGAGGFGREAIYLAESINEVQHTWKIKGFLDNNPNALENTSCKYPIISSIDDYIIDENDVFALGIANPATKEKLSQILSEKGAEFVTLISPKANVHPSATLGKGVVITGGSSVGDEVVIGDFVHIAGSMIGQDSVIGDYSTTTGFTNIAAAKLGKRVFVGSHAVVLNNLIVGDDAFICAGSVVFTNVKSGRKVIGNPAKLFKL